MANGDEYTITVEHGLLKLNGVDVADILDATDHTYHISDLLSPAEVARRAFAAGHRAASVTRLQAAPFAGSVD